MNGVPVEIGRNEGCRLESLVARLILQRGNGDAKVAKKDGTSNTQQGMPNDQAVGQDLSWRLLPGRVLAYENCETDSRTIRWPTPRH